MGRYADIDAICDDMINKLHAIANEASAVMEYETEYEGNLAYKEFGAYQASRIEALFHEAVQEFYDSYSPSMYQRQFGLFDLLDMHMDEHGVIDYDSVDDLIDPDKLHSDRSGGSLYDKVFVQGWHGGAEDGPGHPSPGTPYYRTPIQIERTGEIFYPHWSRPAAKSTPPYQTFRQLLSSAEAGEMYAEFKAISDRHNDIAMEKVRKKVDQISRKYYG